MYQSYRLSALIGFAAISAVASTSIAAIVTPGTTVFATAEANPVGGTVLGTITVPFATATYTGTLTSTVISGDTSNALGGLTFTYAIQNNVTSTNPITRLAVNGYAGFTTDMSYLPASGTIAATLADRDAGSNVIGFSYVGAPLGFGKIDPGALTNLMVVQTNATGFQRIPANVIDGSVSFVDSFAPVVVPEPVSAGAIALAAGLLRRRR